MKTVCGFKKMNNFFQPLQTIFPCNKFSFHCHNQTHYTKTTATTGYNVFIIIRVIIIHMNTFPGHATYRFCTINKIVYCLLLYQVKQGDYLGQNYGKITKISETEIGLREIVQDAAGEWIERASALQLQEKAR